MIKTTHLSDEPQLLCLVENSPIVPCMGNKKPYKHRLQGFHQLDYQDSNLDKQNQNLLCYHYTIVQSLCAFLEKRCKDSAFLFYLPNKISFFFVLMHQFPYLCQK